MEQIYSELNAKIKILYKEGGCTTHPHHFYFQILAELGIIGVFFILLLNLYLSLLLLKQFITKIYPKNIKDIMPFKEFVIVILLFVYFWPLIPHMIFIITGIIFFYLYH